MVSDGERSVVLMMEHDNPICNDCEKKNSEECFHCPVIYDGLQDDDSIIPHEVVASEKFPF